MGISPRRNRIFAIVLTLPLAASLLLAAPVSAAQRGIHLAVAFEFHEGPCLNPPTCTLLAATGTGTVSGNIDGMWTNPPSDFSRPGLYTSDIIVDISPGGTCNVVDELVTFTFAEGSIYVHSHHEDCRLVGLRINGPFTITGGTGRFSGATGGGREFTPAKAGPFFYNGQISF